MNIEYVEPPYFGNLRELTRHAETLADMTEEWDLELKETRVSTYLYERDALENLIGEAKCMIQEATKRVRYLETLLAQEI
jgi:hypothetical protein